MLVELSADYTLHPALQIIDCELCIVACWQDGHVDDSISTLPPALEIIGCKLWIVACWWDDHADDSISTLYPALYITEGELWIVACWWDGYANDFIYSPSCIGNHRMWVVHYAMLVG